MPRNRAQEQRQLRGLLKAAGLRWGVDSPKARATARGVVSRFLTRPRALSMGECDALVEEYLEGPTVEGWPIHSGASGNPCE